MNKMKNSTFLIAGIASGLLFSSCSNKGDNSNADTNLNDTSKETFSIANLVGEVKTVPDSIIEYLHAQHHSHKVLERRTVSAGFETPKMKHWKDYVKKVEDLPVINPGPGEYVHVMEGQKNGYQNLVIGITETFPGGAPPMHTHEGEESHVLLEGEILYALGDTMFTAKGPYIINIPPMVPHAFKNIGNKTANLVVIFPTNVWRYDVVDYFPFDKKENNQTHGHKH
ncbi:MAG: cupin domain-containing protein [Candidatus Kapabacteria bacterium]|nr:cupin domain-containing protein [Candidatus Kapabacteria bacterium]